MSVEGVVTDIVNSFQTNFLHSTLDFTSHYLTGLCLADLFYKDTSTIKKLGLGITGALPDIDFIGEALGVMRHHQFTHQFYSPGFGALGVFSKNPLKNTGFITSNILLHLLADQTNNCMDQIDYLVMVGVAYGVVKYFQNQEMPSYNLIAEKINNKKHL